MYKLSVIVLINKINKKNFKAIDALVNQTLKNIEIICVSNISENEEELIEYTSKYPNISIKKNVNEAIMDVDGEYFAIINVNTFFESTWAQKVYDYAKLDNSDIIVYDFEIMDYKENRIKLCTFENIEKDKDMIEVLDWNLCNLLFKSISFKKLKLKSNNTYNELLFILEALIECKKIGYAQEAKCYLYTNKLRLDDIELKNIEDLKEVLKDAKEIYKAKNLYNEQSKILLSAIAFSKLGVDALIKVSNNSDINVNMKELINNIINYLDINFFEWRNNRLLRSAFMKKEYSYVWYANKMYRYGYIQLYLKLYKILKRTK